VLLDARKLLTYYQPLLELHLKTTKPSAFNFNISVSISSTSNAM
jgi:hypothetical protein